MQHFPANGDDPLVRASLDSRLSWVAEAFDEFGYRTVHVWFEGKQIAIARFRWRDLVSD